MLRIKKVLTLLLAVLMLAGIGCAWAEETAAEPSEITFQDIPWGTSIDDVRLWLLENNVCSADVNAWLSDNEILPVDAVRLSADAVQLWKLGYVMQENGKSVGVEDNDSFLWIQFDDSDMNPDYRIFDQSPESLNFTFYCAGEETTLISVGASFDYEWSVFEALYNEFETVYGVDESGNSLIMADMTGDWRYQKSGEQETMFSYSGTLAVWGKTNIPVPSAD